ncbi:MAG: putative heme transporter [Solirubrobacteraceae bacterium]|jgi:uncharacterized protein (TIRG00374 family)|nr:putative heme transporter [Solirubrobacteraceae bacterium]
MSGAPVESVNPEVADSDDEEAPKITITRRQALLFGVFVVAAVALLYFFLPKLTGLKDTWHRLDRGDPAWLGVGVLFEGLSYCGYVWLFRTVFVRGDSLVDWRASYQITMAGVAATRLFAAAGAGGIALTAWALRRSGMERRIVACRMVAFLVLLYTVYVLALMIFGFGLYLHVFPGSAPFAITMIPAIIGAGVFVLIYTTAFVPQDVERRLARWAEAGGGRRHRIVARLAAAPASLASGVRTALSIVANREWGALGGVVWWGFDIAALWAAFNAFDVAPPLAVIVVAYFVGTLGNTLPLPGGIGGVEGGMIGAFAAFGVDFGLATVSVLTYRAFSFWLPTIPGAVAYLQLRRTVAGWRDQRRADRAAASMIAQP